MSPALDPRPASRYPAVTLSHFRDRLDARAGVTEVPAHRPGARVLHHAAVQLIRLAL